MKKLHQLLKERAFVFATLLIICTFTSCKSQDPLPELNIPKTTYKIEAQERVVEVFYQSDAIVEVIIDPQSTWIEQNVTKSLKLDMLSFVCAPNTTYEERSAQITIYTNDRAVTRTVTITQKALQDNNPQITSFRFEASKNPTLLQRDIIASIDSTGSIQAYIPHITDSKMLIPTIEFSGKSITIKDQQSSEKVDFSKPIVYVVENFTNSKKEYQVSVISNNGIPSIWIQTSGNVEITSKDNYVNGVLTFDGNGQVPSMNETIMKIKGRGNTTWSLPKKPYKIKFDSKQSMAGFPADKEWVLLANALDKTLIRNSVAFELSRLLEMEWSNRNVMVDLYINRKYRGTYLLCEQIKISSNRVNITEATDADVSSETISGGYLFELDEYFDETFKFRTKVFNMPVMIKEPDVNLEQLAWLENHFNEMEACLKSPNFNDPLTGYRQYLDTESFIKWWLVYELMANAEPTSPKSSYMYKDRGGKLKMGPVWDFDWATCVNYEGLNNKESIYFPILFSDNAFVDELQAIWNSKKDIMRSQIQIYINQLTTRVSTSAQANFEKWDIYSNDPSNAQMGNYDSEVQRIKQYFEKRFDYLDVELNKL